MLPFTGNEIPENRIFLDNYSDLVTTLSSANLSQHFVSNAIITIADHHNILSKTDSHKMAETLLRPIAAALEIGYLPSFYKMLRIMKKHGNESVRALADRISQSDELKGREPGKY